jgi:endonuclease III
MDTREKKKRTLRARKMNAILKMLFPDPKIALNHSNTWELLVAVQLSAQCTDARVNTVTERLFKDFRDMEAYAHAPRKELERAIFSCGFYRNKSRNIQQAAHMLLEKHHGVVPGTMRELLQIPGVARKTANVVLSNAFDVHEGIAVDTHVRRFAIRFNLTNFTDPVRIERDLMELMPKREWWLFNHRLVQYGRAYCPARKHDCEGHPLTRVYPKAADIWPKAK